MFYYKNKNDKKKRIFAGAVAVIIVLAMVASMIVSAFADETAPVQAKSYDLTLNKKTTGVFGRGVSYEGISLEGKTYDEAIAEINEYVDDRLTRYMQWDVLGYKYDYDGTTFSTTWTNQDVVDQLQDLTLQGNLVEQYKKQKDLDANPVNLDLQFAVDENAVRSTVAEYTEHFYQEPQNATVKRENGQFVVTEGVTGISFDTDAIANELLAQIEDFSTADDIQYTFPFTQTDPQYTSASFNFSPTPMGSYTTHRLGDAARTKNIQLSADNMNGTIVYPGEKASALTMYEDVTLDNGYVVGQGYENGKVVDSVGGGICQTTTTLYNAVILAELTVVDRRSHSMIISYVPPALDATVDYPSRSDFTFINSTNYPIYIESYISTSDDTVTVNIWGVDERPSNRQVYYTSEWGELTWYSPLYEEIVSDTECTYGNVNVAYKQKTTVDPHPGFTATSYKHVVVDGVETEVTPLNVGIVYKSAPGTIYRASDCTISATPYETTSSYASFPNLGVAFRIDTYTLSGEQWPYYPY